MFTQVSTVRNKQKQYYYLGKGAVELEPKQRITAPAPQKRFDFKKAPAPQRRFFSFRLHEVGCVAGGLQASELNLQRDDNLGSLHTTTPHTHPPDLDNTVINQSINQSINQAIKKSSNQLIKKSDQQSKFSLNTKTVNHHICYLENFQYCFVCFTTA